MAASQGIFLEVVEREKKLNLLPRSAAPTDTRWMYRIVYFYTYLLNGVQSFLRS